MRGRRFLGSVVLLVASSARAEEGSGASVTVRGRARADEAQGVSVSAEEASHTPGGQGDPLKVVQSLPGVVRPSFGLGPLIVWGAAPRETRVYVDGVPIPALYHGGGVRSVVGADFVRDVSLVPGAYGSEYGRGLGGVANVTTRPLPPEGVHGAVRADVLDASAMVSATPDSRVRAAVATRYGYLDRVVDAVSSDRDGSLVLIPKYRDSQAKVSLDVGPRERLSFVFLESADAARFTVPSTDALVSATHASSLSFQRFYAPYVSVPDDKTRVSVTPYYGFDHSREAAETAGIASHLSNDAVVYGIRASRRQRFSALVTLNVGFDLEGTRSSLSREGSLTIPPREGDVTVVGQAPSTDVNADTWRTHILGAAPYVQADVTLGPVVLSPGLRFEGVLIDVSRATPRVGAIPSVGASHLDAALEPRAAVRYRASSTLTFSGAVGVYHSPPAPEDLSAVFGTPALTLASARHATLGQALDVTETTRLELTEYYEESSRLTVRSRRTTPAATRALVQDGEGTSYGVQALVRQSLTHGFSGFLAYTLGRSERSTLGSPTTRLFDFDRTHVFALVLVQEVSDWTFGAKMSYSTGLPRTPVSSSYFDVQSGRYEPLFGAQNSLRLPAFFELDLRVERQFRLSHGMVLTTYAEGLNVTFRKNAEEMVYDHTFRNRDYVTGAPPLLAVGGRLAF